MQVGSSLPADDRTCAQPDPHCPDQILPPGANSQQGCFDDSGRGQ
jgi:hypothetical protein